MMIGMIGGAWFKEGPVAEAEKYVDIPKDAKLDSVTRIYDDWKKKEVHLLHYRVSPPHDHRIIIKLDASTGELLFYSDTSKRCTERVSTDVRISLDEAKKIALDFIARVTVLPEGSRLTRAELLHSQGCGDRMLYEYLFEWSRVINGVEVIGENLRVVVHASSREVVAYNKQWFDDPCNTEIRISKEEAAELGREHLLEGIRKSTSPIASQAMEAILRAEVIETKLEYVRFKDFLVERGWAPKGLWLCWIVTFKYTGVPKDLLLEGKCVKTYVQATTGQVIHVDAML